MLGPGEWVNGVYGNLSGRSKVSVSYQQPLSFRDQGQVYRTSVRRKCSCSSISPDPPPTPHQLFSPFLYNPARQTGLAQISLSFLDYLISFFIFSRLYWGIIFFLFLAVLGLHCCTRAFSSCGEQGLHFVVVHRLLLAVASLVAEHGL